jgi:hypothetical protein
LRVLKKICLGNDVGIEIRKKVKKDTEEEQGGKEKNSSGRTVYRGVDKGKDKVRKVVEE